MQTTLRTLAIVVGACAALAGCANMDRQERATAAGAAIGGVAGSVLSDGSALGTIGGAVIGGAIGHETTDDKD